MLKRSVKRFQSDLNIINYSWASTDIIKYLKVYLRFDSAPGSPANRITINPTGSERWMSKTAAVKYIGLQNIPVWCVPELINHLWLINLFLCCGILDYFHLQPLTENIKFPVLSFNIQTATTSSTSVHNTTVTAKVWIQLWSTSAHVRTITLTSPSWSISEKPSRLVTS